ncbi:MAG: NADP-dependent oxidoreductase [Alphaproteobacteria bacterium]|nr:NADP-dependent oxidoreductase [Alphaproteobacteria bacterium]
MRVREIRLKRYPDGVPKESDFELAEREVPDPGAGQLCLRPLFLSIDPYQRNRMRGPAAGLTPGQVIEGRCVAQVIDSRHPDFAAGELVFTTAPWAEASLSDGKAVQRLDPEVMPPQLHLGAAGVPGLTAFVGLHDIGEMKPGETVLVSAAAGAVGSMACQIAKLAGCRVIGTVGSAQKVRWLLDEVGIDAAIDYSKEPDLTAALRRVCPDGADLVFECVGGKHLEAGLAVLKPHRRVVLCGVMAGMNGQPAGPSNLDQVIAKRVDIKGFVVGDHMARMSAFLAEVKHWLADGALHWHETVIDGIENTPKAFIGLFQGQNLGKMLVRVAGPRASP